MILIPNSTISACVFSPSISISLHNPKETLSLFCIGIISLSVYSTTVYHVAIYSTNVDKISQMTVNNIKQTALKQAGISLSFFSSIFI